MFDKNLEDEIFESSELGDTCKSARACALYGSMIGGPLGAIIGAAIGGAFGTTIHNFRKKKKRFDMYN